MRDYERAPAQLRLLLEHPCRVFYTARSVEMALGPFQAEWSTSSSDRGEVLHMPALFPIRRARLTQAPAVPGVLRKNTDSEQDR